MLEVKDLTVRYGDARVLSGVSFQAAQGATTCVLGPNGSGKTTLLRCISGLASPASGHIVFERNDLRGKKTHEIVRMGLIMIPEGRRVWPPLTVEENLKWGRTIDDRTIERQFLCSTCFHTCRSKNQSAGLLRRRASRWSP
jgi:branched-chain amino acid transport system ATP-binding protein